MPRLKKSSIQILSSLLVGLALAHGALAQDAPADADEQAKKDHDRTTLKTGGIGAAYGSYQGHEQGGVVLQSATVTIGNGNQADNGSSPTRHYGAAVGSLEVGGAGIDWHFSAHTGGNLWQRKGDEPVVPLIGLEPFNLAAGTSIGFHSMYSQNGERISAPHRIEGREPFIEWTPMASVGAQFFTDSCKAMVMLRGGASIGTLGDSGARGAYGAGIMGVCKDLIAMNVDMTRIKAGSKDVDQLSASLGVLFPGQDFGITAVAEGRDTKDAGTDAVYAIPSPKCPNAEVAGKLVIGGRF